VDLSDAKAQPRIRSAHPRGPQGVKLRQKASDQRYWDNLNSAIDRLSV
jgi:hypothetical protein